MKHLESSSKGLTLETSDFQIFHGGNSTLNNSFDKSKFLCCKPRLLFHPLVNYQKFLRFKILQYIDEEMKSCNV